MLLARMLQEHRHVEREVADAVLDHDVFCVEDVGVAKAVSELASELVERGMMLVGAAFENYATQNTRNLIYYCRGKESNNRCEKP